MFRLFDVPEKPNPGVMAYRYIDRSVGVARYDYCGEFDGFSHHYTTIECQEWEVCGFTPKGFYIRCGDTLDARKWIGHNWRKKFAHLSHADAQKSFVYRKKAQIRKLHSQLGTAETALEAALSGHWEGRCPPKIFKSNGGRISLTNNN